MDQSKLSNNLNTEKGIQVEIQMLNTKDVPITYQQPENLKENYICTGWTCEPQTIQVSGTKEMLDTISEIEIPTSEIDVSDATKKVEKTVDITQYELTFESDEVIELKFIGEQTTLDQLDITNAVSIDLQDCKSTGEYEVPVSIEVPDGVELEKQPTIKVKLTEKEDETDQKADKKSDSTQEKSEK